MPTLGKDRRLDFVIVGAQKAGTTALYNQLKAHPRVGTSIFKEVHFFDNEGYFDSAHVSYDDYHRAFPDLGTGFLYGEASPNYIRILRSHERLAAYNPNLKLIALLRNPIDRAHSGWNMRFQRKNERRPFPIAVKEEMIRIRHEGVRQFGSDSYLGRGLYSVQIESLLKHFPREQILFIRYEDYRQDNAATLENVHSFLGLENIPLVSNSTANVIPYDHSINEETRTLLQRFFKEDVARVEKLLGWDCSEWLR